MKQFLLNCAFGPKLYGVLIGNENVVYQPNIFELIGQISITFLEALKTFCTSSSPILVPFFLMRYQPTYILELIKYFIVFYSISFFLRTIGRISNQEYRNFAKLLITTLNDDKKLSLELKNRLKLYDYELSKFPIVDFYAKKRDTKWFATAASEVELENLWEPLKSLRSIFAYWAANSFGRRMLYPGTLTILKAAVGNVLIDGRQKHLISKEAQRNIIKTEDNNYIDSMIWDRRGKSENGKILVICYEGNAGFYEAGIAVTPNSLKYSVLGWNMPGFGESTGVPFPSQIVNAADAIMQFAIQKLGFSEFQIVLYAWSIGGFPASWTAANYPNIKALILDASFDDVVPLAITRTPSFMESLVKYTVKKYLNLPVAQQLRKYHGSIKFIRRWNEEILITDNRSMDETDRRATNRGNFLLIDFLYNRYPGLLLNKKDEETVKFWLSINPEARIMMFNNNEPIVPYNIKELNSEKRTVLIQQLCNKHFVDFEATHNVPLDALYFNIPTEVEGSYQNKRFSGVGYVLGSKNFERKNSQTSNKTLSSLGSSTSMVDESMDNDRK